MPTWGRPARTRDVGRCTMAQGGFWCAQQLLWHSGGFFLTPTCTKPGEGTGIVRSRCWRGWLEEKCGWWLEEKSGTLHGEHGPCHEECWHRRHRAPSAARSGRMRYSHRSPPRGRRRFHHLPGARKIPSPVPELEWSRVMNPTALAAGSARSCRRVPPTSPNTPRASPAAQSRPRHLAAGPGCSPPGSRAD